MANIHRLNDLQIQQNNSSSQNQNTDNLPFMYSLSSNKSPLDETIPYTLKLILCPNIKLVSVTTILIIIIWVYYIFTCILGINKDSTSVLQISVQVMWKWGAVSFYLAKTKFYPLFTASLMHWNLLHITMNTITALFLLSRFQKVFPFYYLLALLIGSALGGNAFSVVLQHNKIAAGFSVCLFGLIGAFIAYMIINWTALETVKSARTQMCCIIGAITVFSLLMSFGPGVDILGHIGGMFNGIFLSLAILPAIGIKNKYFTIIGAILFAVLNIIIFALLYTSQI